MDKLLTMSNFPFCHNVIKSNKYLCFHLFVDYLCSFQQFLAPLAESWSSLCHGELSVVRAYVNFLLQTTSPP